MQIVSLMIYTLQYNVYVTSAPSIDRQQVNEVDLVMSTDKW